MTITPASVRALRTASGLTQRQMAHCLGMSERGLQDWERGVNRPHPAALQLYAMIMLARNRITEAEAAPFMRWDAWDGV